MLSMPEVNTCGVDSCSFNRDSSCHALAITISMLSAPTCGTYADITDQAGYKDAKAGVGACKVVDCTHNKNLECTAKSINIDERDGKILCMTYEAK